MVKYTTKMRGKKYRSRKYKGGDNVIGVPSSQLQAAITSTQTLLNQLNALEESSSTKVELIK